MGQLFVILISAFAIIIVIAGFLFTRNNVNLGKNSNLDSSFPKDTVKRQGKRLSKTELEKKLETLSKTAVSKDLSVGAMCYEIAEPPERAEYVCPKCGHKTIYSLGEASFIRFELPQARIIADTLKKYDIVVLEENFCKRCTNDKYGIKGFSLEIKYADVEKPRLVNNVSLLDLTLIKEFLSGSFTHSDDYGAETPLMEHSERIKYLLGLN